MMMNLFSILTELPEVVNDAALASSASAPNTLVDLPLISKGLMTTGLGLGGVFLVLTLFFVTIRLMQGIKSKGDE